MFYPFVEDDDVELVGVEAGGRGHKPGDHASPLTYGEPGILHGSYSYVMQDEDGQTCDVHCMIAAGLDYPGVGPEHSYWKDSGRVDYVECGDERSDGSLRHASSHRRHHRGVRIESRRRQCHDDRRGHVAERASGCLFVRTRRQGRHGNREATWRVMVE